MRYSSQPGGSRHYSNHCVSPGYGPPNSLGQLLSQTRAISLHEGAGQYSAKCPGGTHCKSPLFSFLWYSLLGTLSLLPPDSQLHVLKSERLLVLFGFSVYWGLKNSRWQAKAIIGLISISFSLSGIPEFPCLLSNMLKSIVSYILIGFFTVPCGRVNMGLIIPSQNLVLFCSEFLIISDLLASSVESGKEWVINKCLLGGQVGGAFYTARE